MTRQRKCSICRKRPPWRYKNCPPGICKRCYHKHVWEQRPGAKREAEHYLQSAYRPQLELWEIEQMQLSVEESEPLDLIDDLPF